MTNYMLHNRWSKRISEYGFLILVLCLVGFVVGVRYQQYVLERNFMVEVTTACDPFYNSCFTSSCTPDDDPSCPPVPYKKVSIIAHDAPMCLLEHTCSSFECTTLQCEILYCAEDVLDEAESCISSVDTTATSSESIVIL